MAGPNGETRMPTFDEMVRELLEPIPDTELQNPERLWGAVAAVVPLLDHCLLLMDARQKEDLLRRVSAMRKVVDAASFKSFQKSQTVEPRFAGMLEAFDNLIARLRGGA